MYETSNKCKANLQAHHVPISQCWLLVSDLHLSESILGIAPALDFHIVKDLCSDTQESRGIFVSLQDLQGLSWILF